MSTNPTQRKSERAHSRYEHDLAYAIRSLAIDLFNAHDLLVQSQRLTALLQECFTELPTVAERVDEDAATLDNILKTRQQDKSRQAEWADSITYEAEIGNFFKHRLSISPKDVAYKEQRYDLDAITRLRWGGVNDSGRTIYTIAFGDADKPRSN